MAILDVMDSLAAVGLPFVDTGARFLSISVGFLWVERLSLAKVSKLQLA